MGDTTYAQQPKWDTNNASFVYIVEVYGDNFISLIIPFSQDQLRHIMTAVMMGIQDIFPPKADDGNNPIFEKKLQRDKGQYLT
jgi:hypothetical protein